jgi:putative serine protease PepD
VTPPPVRSEPTAAGAPTSNWGAVPTAPTPTPPVAGQGTAGATTAAGATSSSVPTASVPTSAEAPATARSSAPRWVTPFAILAALALFVGGALTGWAVAERDDADPDTTAAVEQADGTTEPVSGPVADDVAEPIAAVADAVAPSVVQIETDTGLGSGVVYDDQGHILTAAHVLDGANQVRVRTADGTLVAAEVIGTNEATDVAVIKIVAPEGLVPATLGVGAEVNVGQLAVAVGSPFGLEQTVTSGIVSAVDRPVETEGTSLVGMIQTDASINPGNSGGALADRNGRIIGINDAIRTAGGGNEGVGFAIPIDLAVRVADQIISGEEIRAGLLGVMVSDPTDGPAGALVGEVTPDGPAAESGLEVGDLITGIDGQSVTKMQDLRARVLSREPGDTVVLDVVRDGEELQVEITLGSATE